MSPRREPRLSGSGTSPVQALSLHVGYAYLPTAGTLMVDADVQNPNIPEPAKIQCAIHYVDDGDVRYCVRPVSAGRAEPIRPLQEGETLMDRAQSAGWAHAGQGAFEGPNGKTLQGSLLSVRVGTAWSPYDEGDGSEAPPDATDVAQPRAERAQGGLTAGRKEILDGPSGLDGILQSGEFSVSGTVYFRPLQPFDPAPTIPGTGGKGKKGGSGKSGAQSGEGKGQSSNASSDSESSDQRSSEEEFLSRHQFEYVYPRDKQN